MKRIVKLKHLERSAFRSKDEIHTLRTEAELEIRDRRSELQKKENRLMQKEEP